MSNDPGAPWRERVRGLLAGSDLVVAAGPLAVGCALAGRLVELGLRRALVIGESRGTGAIEVPPGVETLDLDLRADSVMGIIRGYEAALATPDPRVASAIERFDPDRVARAIVPPFSTCASVAGRPVIGARDPRWVALEDKLAADALWDAAGVPRAPSAIVAATAEAIRRGIAAIDRGGGACIAADAREGFNGAAEGVRRATGPDDAAAIASAIADFGGDGARVRVMPMLEGLPCSIHGIVVPGEGIAVLRPIEIVVLRRPGSDRFLYAGTASWWDPPPERRESMRSVARRVGAHLAGAWGWRGGFTVDGVLTAEGFLPTELNARLGAGANGIARAARDDLPLGLVEMMIRDGAPGPWRPGVLEALLLERSDARRGGGAWCTLPRPAARDARLRLRLDGAAPREADEGEPADGVVETGPSAMGGFVRFEPDPERTPTGPAFAPRAVLALRAAEQLLGAAIGPVEAAPDVHAGSATGRIGI